MTISGARKPDILVLAEAPGEIEDQEGEALIGPSGKLLRELLPGRMMERIGFSNSVRCRPDNNRMPTPREVHACSIHLENDIDRYPIKAILGLGNVPLNSVFPGASITRTHGIRMPVKHGNNTVWYWPAFHPAFILHYRDDGSGRDPRSKPPYYVLREDIRRFFAQVDQWKAPSIDTDLIPSTVVMPRSEEDARALIDKMRDPLAVDIETSSNFTNIKPMEFGARILSASFADDKTTMAFPINHSKAQTSWGMKLLLETVECRPWVAHAAGFELGWFLYMARQMSLPWRYEPNHYDDTQALGRLYHQRAGGALRLEELSRYHCGVNIKEVMNVDVNRLDELPIEQVLQYNGLDTLPTARIYRKLIKNVDYDNYESLLNATRATTEMMLMGLPANQETVKELDIIWDDKAKQAEARAHTYYEVKEFERINGRAWNISAPVDVGEALVQFGKIDLPRTAKGKQWSTDEESLKPAVEAGNPVAKSVVDYREAQKMKAPYISSLKEAPRRYVDGLIHPGYNVPITRTLRLSSDDPNQQNWPKHNAEQKKIRQAVEARKGHIFFAADYGQIEARLIAMLSRCPELCKVYLTGFDIHSHWRDFIFREYPQYLDTVRTETGIMDDEKLYEEAREYVKNRMVFQAFFGGSDGGIADAMHIPISIARIILEEFWYRYKGVHNWLKIQRNEYRDTGSTQNAMGVIRHEILPGNEPINNIVQSSAARIVIDSMSDMSRISRELEDPYLHPRMNIHDDLVFEWPDDVHVINRYIPIVRDTLLKIRYPALQCVPLTIDCSIGKRWYDLEKFALFKGDYIR